MQEQFLDRLLTCVDCHGEFIFTAGEQLFFFDKQFKNDPKRCKPCKSRRTGLAAAANGSIPAAAGLSRTETRTTCSECGVETTVPFKPTQGRPVLCRQCFQLKNRAPVPSQTAQGAKSALLRSEGEQTEAGSLLMPIATLLAAAAMFPALPPTSTATSEEIAYITRLESPATTTPAMAPSATQMIAETPVELLHPAASELSGAALEAPTA